MYADEVPLLNTSKEDLDQSVFKAYYNKRYNDNIEMIDDCAANQFKVIIKRPLCK